MANPFPCTTAASDAYRSFELSNASGMSVTISEHGAALRSWRAPDRYGRMAEVLLAEPDGPAYAGCARVFWQGRHAEGAVSLMLMAPGGASLMVNYRLDDDGMLTIEHSAMAEIPAPLRVSPNPYFNLGGDRGVGDHLLQIDADYFVEVDAVGAPIGVATVDRTPFDFRHPAPIGVRLRWPDSRIRPNGEFDHCFLVDDDEADGQGALREVARVFDPRSGRCLQMFTTAAALQFCTGSRIQPGDVAAGSSSCRGGFGLEATARPDLMSEAWPPIVLQPGQVYRRTTAYRMSLEYSRIGR